MKNLDFKKFGYINCFKFLIIKMNYLYSSRFSININRRRRFNIQIYKIVRTIVVRNIILVI